MDSGQRSDPAPAAGATGAAPPLARARDQRVLAGVCGGLARHTGIDPIVYRVTFGVLGLAGGVGVLLYGAAWVLLPRDDTDRSPVERHVRRRIDGPAVLAVLAVVLAVPGLYLRAPTLALLVVLALAGLTAHRRGVDLAAAVRAVPGRLRFPRLPREAAGPAAAADGPTVEYPYGPTRPSPKPPFGQETVRPDMAAFHQEPPTLDYRTSGFGAGYPPYGDATQPYGPPSHQPYDSGNTAYWPYPPQTSPHTQQVYLRPSEPPNRRGGAVLTLLTITAAFVVAGVLAALTLLGVGPPGTVILAATVMVLGFGMVVGARYGRGRPLIGAGMLASLLLVASTAIVTPRLDGLVSGGFGEVTWRPAGAAAGPYHLGAGEATLDLTELTGDRPYDVTASVDMGELRVRVPPGADVTVHAHVGLGDVMVGTKTVASGPGTSVTRTLPGDGNGTPIELRLNVDMGEVKVRRVSP